MKYDKQALKKNKYQESKNIVRTNALVEFHADDGMLVSFIMSSTVTKFGNPTSCTTISSSSIHKPICYYQTYYSI